MKKSTPIVMALLLAATSAGWTQALDGREIMRRVEDRDSGETIHALVGMTLIDKDGTTRERIVEGWGQETGDGVVNVVIVFHRPASVEGTRFLVRENEGRPDDRWIYLPALGRVRRIAASEDDSAFMGTDYTYGDLQTRDVEEDRHRLLREESAQGHPCYVVESVPKDPGGSQYSRRVQWITKNSWVPVRVELYDGEAAPAKVQTVPRLEPVQGYWTPMESLMEDMGSGHKTRLIVQRILYNEELPDALFTTRFLETGRVR